MTEQLAYCAGFLDGAACISIAPVNKGRQLEVRITLSSKSISALDYFKTALAIGKNIDVAPSNYASKIQITSRADTRQALTLLQPYTLLKSAHIDIALQCLDTHRDELNMEHMHRIRMLNKSTAPHALPIQPYTFTRPKELEYAYLSGLFDADGRVIITPFDMHTLTQVVLTSQHFAALLAMQTAFPSSSIYATQGRTCKWNMSHMASLLVFIDALKPNSIAKVAQLERLSLLLW